jgi:hypothetical protein
MKLLVMWFSPKCVCNCSFKVFCSFSLYVKCKCINNVNRFKELNRSYALTNCAGGQEINLVGQKGGSIDTRAEALQSSHDLATHATLYDVNSVLQLPAIRICLVGYITLYQLLRIITTLENRDDSWLMCQLTTEPWNAVGKTTRQATYYNGTSSPFTQFLYLLSYSNSPISFQLQRALLWRFIVAATIKYFARF